MTYENLKVKVTAHKQNLIIETIDGKEDKNFVPVAGKPVDPNHINYVKQLLKTNQSNGEKLK